MSFNAIQATRSELLTALSNKPEINKTLENLTHAQFGKMQFHRQFHESHTCFDGSADEG